MIDPSPESAPDSPVERTWQPEPELTSPPPRLIAARLRERLVRWLFVTLTLIVPAALSYFGYVSQKTLSALIDHGATTVGKVVERRPPHKKSLPHLVYEYQVDGQSYRVTEGREKSVWDKTLLGTEAPIRYLPESPGDAYTEHEMQTASGTSPTAIGLWIVSAVLIVFSGPFWLYLELRQARVRHVVRYGVPTAGVVTEVDRYGPASYDQWRVKYAFAPTPESTREGTAYLHGSDVKALGPGTVVTVIVDPTNEKRFELYSAAAKLYRVVPDTH